MTQTVATDARDLFKAAYENRYTWDSSFPGYSAGFTLELDGVTHTGQVTITAGLQVEVQTEDPKAQEWLRNQLKDVVVHRKRSYFEESHGNHTFAFDGEPDSTGAQAILVGGDAMGSHYKVRDQQVVMVSRVMGRVAFTINHLEKLDTGNGYISTDYNAVFTNPKDGQVVRQVRFQDFYTPFDGHYLMTKQIVSGTEMGQKKYTAIEFTNIRLGA
ncbi:DUF3386 domain-containing protein [Anthocerotibacter panamensis]|uniref:DUF3386 domain-containing protein n=1 Tax=Anthocerotibacter panamensis TaxID=2857077 RepID=UPI001C404282|nr:DUF3386 domain-containing protein [Anthocerotibacter panamensis]